MGDQEGVPLLPADPRMCSSNKLGELSFSETGSLLELTEGLVSWTGFLEVKVFCGAAWGCLCWMIFFISTPFLTYFEMMWLVTGAAEFWP